MNLVDSILNGTKKTNPSVSRRQFNKAVKDLAYSLYDSDYNMRGYLEILKDGSIKTWTSFDDEYAFPATGNRAFLTWERGVEASPGRKREAIRDLTETMSSEFESQMNRKGIYFR